MTTFVLVHGAWHDGSAWGAVIKTLEQHEHTAYAPTMAGHGRGVNKAVTHAQSVQSVVDYITERNLSDIVLVGHSFGGTIISKVVEAIPERIKRLVFWNAFVLLDGESLNDNCPPHYRTQMDDLAAASDDNSIMLPYPIWREVFINDADAELAQSTYALLSPQPNQFNERLDLKKFYALVHGNQMPFSYINCTEDTALPKGEWSWVPRMSSRLGLYRLVQMSGSHEVIFTNPVLLAEKIIEAGRN